MNELIEFLIKVCVASAASIVGFHVLGPIAERLLGRGGK